MTSAIEREASDLRMLARRLAEPWPAEERFAQWRRGRPETRGSRLSGLFPHASEPPAGPPDRVTVTSALRSAARALDAAVEIANPPYDSGPFRISSTGSLPGGLRADVDYRLTSDDRAWMSVPDARVRPEHSARASGNPAWRSRAPARADRQRLHASGPVYPDNHNGHSWMPSIAGVGPVVLRFAEAVEQPPEVPPIDTIRRGLWLLPHQGEDAFQRWLDGLPAEVVAVIHRTIATTDDVRLLRTPAGLDNIARAVHERLVADLQPRTVPAAVKHLGALPRMWTAARARRSIKRRGGGFAASSRFDAGDVVLTGGQIYRVTKVQTGPGIQMLHRRRSHRALLGELAARYTPRRPDGSCNRHDARRWMRAFARDAASQASDMLEEGRPGARRLAIGALCSMIGLDDAIRLTERPRGLADYVSMTVDLDAHRAELDRLRCRSTTEPVWATATTDEILSDIAAIRPGLDWYLNQDVGMPWLETQAYPWITATGADLDAVAARFDLARFSGETDERFRARIGREANSGSESAVLLVEPREHEIVREANWTPWGADADLRHIGMRVLDEAREYQIDGALAAGLEVDQTVELRGRALSVEAIVVDTERVYDGRGRDRQVARLREVRRMERPGPAERRDGRIGI